MKNQGVKKHSYHIRLWHWLNAIVICGSLFTVLLNSTIFDVRENANYIQDQLQKTGANVSHEQAKAVSHGMEDRIWDLHIYFGYALAALFLYRLVYGLTLKKNTGFFAKLKGTFQLYFTQRLKIDQYELGIRLLYLLCYVLLLLMVLTGFSVAFDEEIGLSREFSHTLKEIHGFCMYPILGFIVLHIAGVFLAERKNKKGIVSEMINGGEL